MVSGSKEHEIQGLKARPFRMPFQEIWLAACNEAYPAARDPVAHRCIR
jgi:hypothetical protein